MAASGIQKCQMFINSFTGQGWSEVYWTKKIDLTAALSAINVMVPLRKSILAAGFAIVACRVSDTGVKGDSLISLFGATENEGNLNKETPPEPADTCLVLRMQTTTAPFQARKVMFLHGISEELTRGTSGSYSPNAEFSQRFLVFTQGLKAQGFGILKNTFGGAFPPFPGAPITSAVQLAGSRSVTIATAPPFVGNYPGIVNIVGTRGQPGLRGIHTLTSKVDAGTFSFNSKFAILSTGFSGFVQTVTPDVISFDPPILVVRVGERKVGRAFGLPLGRRRV